MDAEQQTKVSTCTICKERLIFGRWTDLHGVTTCGRCGAPYRIYHYDENNKSIDKPAELLILEAFVAPLQRYWAETKKCVAPGAFNIGYANHQERMDAEALGAWLDKTYPKAEVAS